MFLRLLIVDDNARFLRAAADVLGREEIRVVASASNGAEALERARELRPDVTLVDVDLGDESGFDVARLLAQPTGGAGAAVILISAYPEQDFTELIEASPALGFLSKSRLSGSAIRELIERANGSTGDRV